MEVVEGGRGDEDACEEHLLKCQKMGLNDEREKERGREVTGRRVRARNSSKLMSHLRQPRGFQVWSTGSVFRKATTELGNVYTSVCFHFVCVSVCVCVCQSRMC